MGFKLALLCLFFLVGGLALRTLWAKSGKTLDSPVPIVFTHIAALLLGILLSPRISSVIDESVRSGIRPILEMAFGWVGFLFGFQFNAVTLRRIPPRYLLGTFLEGITTFVIIAASALFALGFFAGRPGMERAEVWETALALGAVLAISSPTIIGTLHRRIRARSPVVTLLTVATSTDGVIGVIALGVINILWHPSGVGWTRSLILMFALGIGEAFLLWLLLRTERKAIPTAILGIGVLTLGAGVSAYVGLAPVVTGAIAGAVAANLAPGLRQRLARMLHTAESGLYLGLIILAGVFLPVAGRRIFAGAVCLGILRMIGKFFGGELAFRIGGMRSGEGIEHQFAGALQPAGALTLIAALCFSEITGGTLAPLVVLSAIVAFVIGEVLGGIATSSLLRRLTILKRKML